MGGGLGGSLTISISISFTPPVPVSSAEYLPSPVLFSKRPDFLSRTHSTDTQSSPCWRRGRHPGEQGSGGNLKTFNQSSCFQPYPDPSLAEVPELLISESSWGSAGKIYRFWAFATGHLGFTFSVLPKSIISCPSA